jgi:Zn-dependent peptidase ImmA (M78 family)
MSITAKVNELINLHKTNCPFRIAKSMGINVLYENLGSTLGYYNKNFRIKFIHINENASDRQKEFICSHELGHAVLHPEANTPFLKKNTYFSTNRIEIEANTFAVRLLFANDFNRNNGVLKETFDDYGIPQHLFDKHLENKFF